LRVRSGTAAARLGFVDNVIMNQRGSVNNFLDRAQFDGAPSVVIEKPRREQQQHGTNALAATAAQIFADLGNRLHARNRIPPELALNRREIATQQFEDFFSVDDGWRAQSVRSQFTTSSVKRRKLLVGSVIRKLRINAKILGAQQRDDFL
jgi:hypothetical protein